MGYREARFFVTHTFCPLIRLSNYAHVLRRVIEMHKNFLLGVFQSCRLSIKQCQPVQRLRPAS